MRAIHLTMKAENQIQKTLITNLSSLYGCKHKTESRTIHLVEIDQSVHKQKS